MSVTELQGVCLCSNISVRAQPAQQHMSACHCSNCRRWNGGVSLAIGCGDKVEISGNSLGVYQSSQWAERVFCKNCGTSIAWRLQAGGEYHVNAQLFNESESFDFTHQIFIDDKPANYAFVNETQNMTGAEVFAMFAGENQADHNSEDSKG